MKDLLVIIGWSVGWMFLGMLLGATITYQGTERMRGAAYVDGVLDCEQFHALQEKRDQLQGVPAHAKIETAHTAGR